MPHSLLGRKKFRSFVDVREARDLSDCSGSEESLPYSLLGASEFDIVHDLKSSSGGTDALKRAFSRTFSWKKKKLPCKPESYPVPSLIEKPTPDDSCKIYVIGNSGIGKTAAVVRFLTGKYIHEYQSSEEEYYQRRVALDGTFIDVQITSMTSKGNRFEEKVADAGCGIILAYSVLDYMSYCYAQTLLKEIHGTMDVPVILAGLKVDMVEQRCIRKSAAEKLAEDYGCVYFEVSAATNVAVHESFEHAMRETLLDRKKRTFSTRSRSGSRMSVRRRSSVS